MVVKGCSRCGNGRFRAAMPARWAAARAGSQLFTKSQNFALLVRIMTAACARPATYMQGTVPWLLYLSGTISMLGLQPAMTCAVSVIPCTA